MGAQMALVLVLFPACRGPAATMKELRSSIAAHIVAAISALIVPFCIKSKTVNAPGIALPFEIFRSSFGERLPQNDTVCQCTWYGTHIAILGSGPKTL